MKLHLTLTQLKWFTYMKVVEDLDCSTHWWVSQKKLEELGKTQNYIHYFGVTFGFPVKV